MFINAVGMMPNVSAPIDSMQHENGGMMSHYGRHLNAARETYRRQ